MLYILFIVLFALFSYNLYSFKKINNLTSVKFGNFGKNLTDHTEEKEAYNERITNMLIRHKNFAFFAFFASIAISFLFGLWFIYKVIVEKEFNMKLIVYGAGIAGGITLTKSFNNLDKKCGQDLKDFEKKMIR